MKYVKETKKLLKLFKRVTKKNDRAAMRSVLYAIGVNTRDALDEFIPPRLRQPVENWPTSHSASGNVVKSHRKKPPKRTSRPIRPVTSHFSLNIAPKIADMKSGEVRKVMLDEKFTDVYSLQKTLTSWAYKTWGTGNYTTAMSKDRTYVEIWKI